MDNMINWFEIPVTDFNRAKKFYETMLGIQLERIEMHGMVMGFFPADGQNVSGAIVQGEDQKPSTDGSTLYLNGGEDLSGALNRAKGAGATVIVPKTQISPEQGYFAMFIDTEGNRIALHSIG